MHPIATVLLIALGPSVLFVAFRLLAVEVRQRQEARRRHTFARQAAGVDNPLAHSDLSDLDGQIRRLLDEQEAGQ